MLKNKMEIFIILFIVAFFIILFLGPSIYIANECRDSANKYFKNIVEQNFTDAASYVSLFPCNPENKITYYNEAKRVWANKMLDFKDKNIYIESYSGLRVFSFGKNQISYVTIQINDNDIKRTYTTKILFGKVHGRMVVRQVDIGGEFGVLLSGGI